MAVFLPCQGEWSTVDLICKNSDETMHWRIFVEFVIQICVYYKVHYYALYVLVPQVLSSIACAAIAVQEESVHPLNLESRLNNLIP